MKLLHRLFPAGHLFVSILFLIAAAALIVMAVLQLWQGVQMLESLAFYARLNALLEAIAILTVAVAALQLGQTVLEEEVQREAHMSSPTRVRRFISRFLVVLVVALSIETVVLTFRLSQETSEQLPNVAAIGLVAAALLVAWGLFIRFNRSAEELEPEAMHAVKREDRKVESNVKGGSSR